MVLEARSPKISLIGRNQGITRAVLSLEAQEGRSGPGLFQLLGAAGCHWLVAASL